MFTMGMPLWGGAASASASDPNFSYVIALLHADGPNGATTFNDSSSYSNTVTNSFGVTVSTAQSVFGGASAEIATSGGSSRVLCINPPSSLCVFTTQDFTFEFWFRATSTGTAAILIATEESTTNFYPAQIVLTAGAKVQFKGFNSADVLIYDISSTTTIATNQWYFVQARRAGNVFALALNGAQEASVTLGASPTLKTAPFPCLSFGNYYSAATYFPLLGFMDDIRVTKGVARNFEAPLQAFPDY